MVPASCEIGRARLKAMITTTIPTSMMVGMFSRVSMSQRMLSRSINRCSSQGSTITLRPRVSTAEKYKCGCLVANATTAVFTDSTNPCSANR